MTAHDLPVNKNGRVYPPDVLREAIRKAQPKIDAGRMFGQLESPVDGRTRIGQASHVVRWVKTKRDGSVVASMEFLDTPAGRTAFEMIKQGAPMSGALRGRGTVEGNVVTEMDLSSVDVTMFEPEFEPSAVDQLADIVAEDDEEEEG
jgi:hypothetical protein